MDIKDSYLHGTVGVVKSISVSADKLKYTLADIAGTVREVTLPVATTSANGLMSSGDKTKLDNLSSTIGNYVTLNTVQTITESKTFSKLVTFSATPGILVTRSSGVPYFRFGKDADNVYGAIGADDAGDVCVYNDITGSGWSTVLHSRNYTKWVNTTNFPGLNKTGTVTSVTVTGSNGLSGTGTITSSGTITLSNAGVRSIATGTTNGTISVNTNGTSANVTVKGLGSAAYTTSGSYVQLGYIGTITDVADLYSKLKPYFGDNYVSITKLKDERGVWGHLLSKFQNPDLGLYGVDGCGLFLVGGAIERWSISGKNTTDDPLVYNKYRIFDAGNLGVVSSSDNGLAPKVINTNTATVGSAYYVLASTNGSATPSWYKLPANAFANDDTKVTQTNTTKSASYRVLFSGNANDTTETTTVRKSANLLFNPSTGNLTATSLNLNGDIVINDGTNHNRYIKWLYANTDDYGWRIGYLGLQGGDNNDLTFDSHRKGAGWASALYFKHTTLDAHFAGIVIAPTFQGNLDGTYVNKLTGYSKAESAANLAATDTLNTALGKLEYKAHYAYNWVIGVTATDTDTYINKWSEIVGFLDSVKEGTDILDEFVTRKTNLTIIGLKNFNTDTNTKPLLISRGGLSTEVVAIGVDDSQAIFEYTNDEKANSYVFKMVNTDTEGSDGSGANTSQVTFTGNSAGSSVTATTFIGKLSNTLTFSAGAFAAKTYNNSLGVTVNIPTHTSHLTNNSGFLTQHLSLANYVTLNTALTITGLKTFQSDSSTTGVSLILKNKGWAGGMSTAMDFYNGGSYSVPNARIATYMNGSGKAGGTLIFYTQTKHASTNPNPNGLTERLRIDDNGLTKITGSLTVTSNITGAKFITSGGTSSLFVKGDGSLDGNTYISTKDVTLELLGVNKILFERFSRVSSVGNNPITEKDLIGRALIDAVLINDFGSYEVGENYFGRLTTYLYFSANTEWTTTGYNDDGGTIYLNDVIIASLISCQSTSITLNFVKGWNKLVWIFNENAGTDCAYFGSSIKSVSNLVYMNAYPVTVPEKTHQSYISDTAKSLNAITVVSSGAFNLSNASWTNTGYTFESLTSGTYAIQVTCGNLVASGIMSVYKNITDTAGDEIPLHVYHDSTQPWRPYLRTSANKLLISSNDASATSRTVTIKIALIL